MAEEHEDEARAKQARVLRALAARLERGDGSLPTDVFGPIERELELRLDREAVTDSWAEQGEEMETARARPREVRILVRALRDLGRLSRDERLLLSDVLERLARDPVPRGAALLEGQRPNHLRYRVGRFRVLYRVTDGEIAVVAITIGMAEQS